MNHLVYQANSILAGQTFEYAVCGGYAIDLFLGYESRKHGDIDIMAFWSDRDKIIKYMQNLDYEVYEMLGGGKGFHITDIRTQYKVKNNIFCCKKDCELVRFYESDEKDIYVIDFERVWQSKLNFVEFIFNEKRDGDFLYSRNNAIKRNLKETILYNKNIPYLAPEICLLYKSTDTAREGYQQDYELAVKRMSEEQKNWFEQALMVMNPNGHKWSNIEKYN